MKKKRIFFIFLFLVLASAYTVRVSYVNRDNTKTRIHYIEDGSPAKTQNFEIRVEKKALYDVAAFVKEFPTARTFYTYQGSIYEQMDDRDTLLGIKYVLYAEVVFKNITDEIQEVDTANYSLFMNESYHNGLNPFLIEELNQFSGLSLKPGHTYTVKFAFDLHEKNIDPARYQDIASQDFSLALTGYPHIQRLKLSDIPYIKTDAEADTLYQDLIAMTDAERAARHHIA